MMSTPRATLFLLAISAASAWADEAKPEPKGDLAKLQGAWTSQAGPNDETRIDLSFKGDKVHFVMSKKDADDYISDGEIVVDEAAKPHKALTWKNLTDPNGADLGEVQSIYAFEDENTLKICSGGPGKDRPTEFKGGEGDVPPPYLTVLKRKAVEQKAAAAIKGDHFKLQGKWTAMAGPDKAVPIFIAVKDNAITFKGTTPNGEEFEFSGEFKIDDQAKPHKTIDWVNFKAPNGDAIPDNLAIYEVVDNDTFKVCNGGPGAKRPTEFKDGEDAHAQVLTLKRDKPKD
ncbi:TIGR03067 domain-containing protein [Singulisphaera sp. PoT]|uniref:TIGR03067 domain-containing protein n=1 Tax=Singulisphaera sp. PoT TaxID=3411797 RepID=UPI003BF4A8BD